MDELGLKDNPGVIIGAEVAHALASNPNQKTVVLGVEALAKTASDLANGLAGATK